jgi:cell division protein FtsL
MKNIIITVIVTALVMVTGYFVFVVVKMQSQVNSNTANLNQIVEFLNKQIEASAPVTK